MKKIVLTLIFASFASCAGHLYERPRDTFKTRVNQSAEATPEAAESLRNQEFQERIADLSAKNKNLEEEIALLKDQLEKTETQLTLRTGKGPVRTEDLSKTNYNPPSLKTISVHEEISKTDPEKGFLNDDAVQQYRNAKVLFDSKKYSESVSYTHLTLPTKRIV